jgi:hypothetical protein
MEKYLKDHPYMEPNGLQENKEDYPEVRDALLNFFPEAEIIDIELIGSSALSPEEREAQDIEKYGFSRGDERDIDLLATIAGIDEDDAERWAFSEEAEELEMFYNFDVQVLPERLEEKWSKSERRKRAKKCDNPKGFSMKQFCDNLNEDDFDSELEPYKESDFTPAQLLVLKNVADKQFDKIDMDSPEISKAVYSLNKDGYINFDTGELTDPGRIVLSDIYGGKYDFETYLFGGLNEEEAFQKAVKKKHKKMKIRLIGLGGGKNTRGTKKPSYKRSKSAPPGFGGSLEENK